MIKIILWWLIFFTQVGYAQEHVLNKLVVENTNSTDFLSPDQAFKIDLSAIDDQTLKADFTVAPGHYLYRQRISFKVQDENDVRIIATHFPDGEMKEDPNFGTSEVYHHDLTVLANLEYQNIQPEKIEVIASFQGCSEMGLCYAPMQKKLTVSLPKSGVMDIDKPALDKKNDSNAANSNQDDEVNKLLKGGNLWLVVLGFFGFGLLLSLTPCVFPMIPILSGIIVGQGKQTSKMHSFNLSVAYTLGMALSYTLAGVVAGLSGQLISAALQNPWVLGASALVFVLLALSMFGFYELQLPSSMESSVLNFTNRIKGGKFISVFVMGILSALIVSPCVAAPLAGALLYIGQTHDVLLGGLALFFLSLGMGVPLLIVGASAGALLPKAGRWMEAVRHSFGVLMLGMAIWLISSVIPSSVQMLLWAALFITSSVYLHALETLPETKTKWSMFWKGIGIILFLYGVSLFYAAMSGGHNLLQPFSGFQSSAVAKGNATSLIFKQVKNIDDLNYALKEAHGKHVMLDFYADWCSSCKEYEQLTFSDPSIKKRLNDVVLLQADVTDNSVADIDLLKRFKLYGPPGIIFFNKEGKEYKANKIVGFLDAVKFGLKVDQILAEQ